MDYQELQEHEKILVISVTNLNSVIRRMNKTELLMIGIEPKVLSS